MKHIAEMSLPIAILLLVGTLCMWIPVFQHTENIWNAVITLSIAIINADFLMFFCHKTRMTRNLNWMPVLMYLLPFGMGIIACDWKLQIGIFFLFASIHMIILAFRQDKAVEESFLATAFLLCGTIFLPQLIWLLPFIWISFIIQSAFNLRVFSASIIAILAFAAIDFAGFYLFQWTFPWHWNEIINLTFIPFSFTNWKLYILAAFGIFFIISNYMFYQRENATVQSLLNIFIIPFLMACVMQSPAILIAMLAGISAHYYISRQSLSRGIFFIIYILFCVGSLFL